MSNGNRKRRGLKRQFKRRGIKRFTRAGRVTLVQPADSPYHLVLDEHSAIVGKLLLPSEDLYPSERLYPGDEWKDEWSNR